MSWVREWDLKRGLKFVKAKIGIIFELRKSIKIVETFANLRGEERKKREIYIPPNA